MQGRLRPLSGKPVQDDLAVGRMIEHHADPANPRFEHDWALNRVMIAILQDRTQLFKYFSNDPEFKRWLQEWVCEMT